jgi:asparagine synthase (glutamine-hydrolysing)
VGSFDESKAKYALSKLAHRGPDACEVVQNNHLFFAHQRLSIIDTHKRANQPLHVDDILLSFNGEIYNHKELRELMADEYEFQTNSDSEVIIAAYKKWGLEFVQHLRGMFAIALMDKDKLYLFRDRFGKKPLFYLQNKDSFIFASEIKALLVFLEHVEMDEDALLSYLSFLAPTPPFTFFKGIKKLEAGEFLSFDGGVKTKTYYDVLDTKSTSTTCIDDVQMLLKQSIEMRLESDVPMASLLSGGIDSASINYFAKQNSKQLQTYTVGYKGFDKYDERENAKESAKLLGLENKAVEIDKDSFLDASDAVLDSLDEPLNDPASVPLYMLFEEIKKDGYKVVMSGEGSDEIFLGYRQYFEYLDIETLSKLKNKNWLKRYFKNNYTKHKEWEHYKRVFEGSILFRTSGECFTDLQKNALLRLHVEDNQALKYLQKYRDSFERSKHSDESVWYSYIDLKLFQSEHYLSKLDRVSMAHSIESRTPFLDHKLVEGVFSLEPKLRYEDGVTKSLLKQIMKDKLDEKILSRKKKGFSNPYIEYLRESKKISLIQEVNKQSGLFKQDILKELVNGPFKHHIWGLYVLSVWIKKHLL